jgi:hypothetical protein
VVFWVTIQLLSNLVGSVALLNIIVLVESSVVLQLVYEIDIRTDFVEGYTIVLVTENILQYWEIAKI